MYSLFLLCFIGKYLMIVYSGKVVASSNHRNYHAHLSYWQGNWILIIFLLIL